VKIAVAISLIRTSFSWEALIFALVIYPLYAGIPTAASTPMIATTINNSIRVKPLAYFMPPIYLTFAGKILRLLPASNRRFR
jgi:hypothetical protein